MNDLPRSVLEYSEREFADLVELDARAVRRQVSVIFQDFLRYELSAAANVGLGRHEDLADFDRVVAAARLAGADPFLSKLPAGYETLLSRAFQGGTGCPWGSGSGSPWPGPSSVTRRS